MKLYIHFGIYKAGSSYLQYVCANAREQLMQKKIYFPPSKEDAKMKDGLISKGNADGLEVAFKAENSQSIKGILSKWYNDAVNNDCTMVLISAESLVHQLAIENRLQLLLSVIKEVGYKEVYAMGFFRDLADHALSTFKHRAKSGKIKNFEHWIQHVYETPVLLENLAKQIELFPQIEWRLRKFQKNGTHLKQIFFKEWLQIQIPAFEGKQLVNESLTLSEIHWMQALEPVFPLTMDRFVNNLKELPGHLKAKDSDLNAAYYNEAIELLRHHQSVLNKINVFFKKDEQLLIDELRKRNDENQNVDATMMNHPQIQLIVHQIAFQYSLKGRYIYWRRWIFLKIPLSIKKLIKQK